MSSPKSPDMRRDFANRDELIAYLTEQFPHAAIISDEISEMRGGRVAAEERLAKIDPLTYKETRNHLDGRVTRLSPYIRHNIISLSEVRTHALQQAKKRDHADKLIQELAWRDYFQRAYEEYGDRIWEDIEPYKTGWTAEQYSKKLPDDIREGRTGTPMDQFIHELYETGYLHNHARMWLAAYIIHWRRICWQTGARWFLIHLLDGDPASNNLSWQWVASTFSSKPYFYNLRNLRKFGVDLQGYDLIPFEGSYEEIERRLFPHKPPSEPPQNRRGKKGRGKNRRYHQN